MSAAGPRTLKFRLVNSPYLEMVAEDPVTGQEYLIRLAIIVKNVVHTGDVNPIDGTPLLETQNVLATTTSVLTHTAGLPPEVDA